MDITKEITKSNSQVQPFREMISPILSDIYKFIYSIIRNKEIAEDIMQTSILTAYKNLNDLRERDKFKPWIFTIARNETMTYIRKNSREIAVDIQELNLPDENNYDGPEEYIINNELRAEVIEAINSLNSEDKDIIILHYYDGLQFQEIAKMLSINYGTVRSRHRLIKEKIFNYMVDKNYITIDNTKADSRG